LDCPYLCRRLPESRSERGVLRRVIWLLLNGGRMDDHIDN
jgi:hypothetical protein